MITYHPNETTNRDFWLDVALDGERVGYILKDKGSAFYEVTINKRAEEIRNYSMLMRAYLTLAMAKEKIGEFLDSENEAE